MLDTDTVSHIVSDMDMLIAAIALSTGAILVTHNKKHFSKIKGLRVEDWC
jgi:predicted nucleic acid-binding protein